MATAIKPSDVKNWNIIKNDTDKHSRATKEIKHPDWYSYYQNDDGYWYPHRKPTVNEILIDTFH